MTETMPTLKWFATNWVWSTDTQVTPDYQSKSEMGTHRGCNSPFPGGVVRRTIPTAEWEELSRVGEADGLRGTGQ